MATGKKTSKEANPRAIIVSVITVLQIAVYLIALWFYKYYPTKGLEGLGYQVFFGGIFISLGIANLIALTVYIIWLAKTHQRFSVICGFLLSTLLVLILLAPTLSN